MKYRVVKAYGPWSVDHVFTEMPGNVARTLIGRGLIEPVAAEKAISPSPVDRMMRPSDIQTRGTKPRTRQSAV